MDFSPYAGSNLLQFSLPVFRPLVSGTRLTGGLEAVALATKFGQYRQGDRPRRRARRRGNQARTGNGRFPLQGG